MLDRILMVAACAVFCGMVVCGGTHADRRQYLATYGYYTPEKGEVEIEQWIDSLMPRNGGTTYRSKTEIEYGVTDRLMAAVYFINQKAPGEHFGYAETKLEVRYRVSEPGRNFWDMAGYLELVCPNASREAYEMEMKGILSHEFPEFNLTLNITGEKKLRGSEEIEFGYAVGIAPQAAKPIKYSLEVFGSRDEHYLMPVFWITPGNRQSIGIGVAKGLTKSSDDIQIRTLYAIEF